MSRLFDFCVVYRLYAKHHSRTYAARMAFDIVFRNLPF